MLQACLGFIDDFSGISFTICGEGLHIWEGKLNFEGTASGFNFGREFPGKTK